MRVYRLDPSPSMKEFAGFLLFFLAVLFFLLLFNAPSAF